MYRHLTPEPGKLTIAGRASQTHPARTTHLTNQNNQQSTLPNWISTNYFACLEDELVDQTTDDKHIDTEDALARLPTTPRSTKNINTNTPIRKAKRKLPISYALPSILISPASQVSHTTNRLEMCGTVGDIPCNWIIDTGAQCTVIVRSLADQAKVSRTQPMFQPYTADGSRLGVSQDLLATIQVGTQTLRNTRITVVENLAYPAILGMDCLQQLGLSLTLGNDCILKPDLATTLQPQPGRPNSDQHGPPAGSQNQPFVGLIYNSTTVTIPAGCFRGQSSDYSQRDYRIY